MGLSDIWRKTSGTAGSDLPLQRVAEPQLFQLWTRSQWPNVDVVGESFYSAQIRGLLPRKLGADGSEVFVEVRLVHEPTNKYDANAIAVHAPTGVIGHLARDDAATFAPVLSRLQAQGLTACTTARIWGRADTSRERSKNGFFASVQVVIPEPHLVMPVNDVPTVPHRLLPHGSAIQLAGEDQHLDVLASLLGNQAECWAFASLHEMAPTGRSKKPTVRVDIDGSVIGTMSPKLSADMLPVIRHLAAANKSAVARTVLKGNQLMVEASVFAARTHEIPAKWLAEP